MAELRGADAEGERAQAAMGRGVAVAADQRRARQGQALLRPDDMDDAVAVLADVEQAHARLGGVGAQAAQQRRTRREGLLGAAGPGRDGVVGRGRHQARLGQRIALVHHLAQRPCARQVVQQDAIDVQQHEAAAQVGDDVAVPDLVVQRFGHSGFLREPG